jgi:hypothetical protein
MPIPLIGAAGSAAATGSSFVAEGASNAATIEKNMQAVKNAFDSVQNLRVNSAINLMNSAGENAKSIRM